MGKFGMSAGAEGMSQTLTAILFTFTGIALYNTIELSVLIFITFKRYKGLYFWSLVIACLGIIPYTLGLIFKFYGVITNNWISVCIIIVGWQTMVTGQSVVMYSRLHLVTTNRKLLRAVLAMICINWLVSDVPISVLVLGNQSTAGAKFIAVYGVWERVQVCLYAVQECIIACLYIVQVAKLLRVDTGGRGAPGANRGLGLTGKSRRLMKHLIYVNILIIALDIALLAVEFAGLYQIQVMFKGALYSAKLKMEFYILTELTAMSSHMLRQAQSTFSNDEVHGNSYNATTPGQTINADTEHKISSAGATMVSTTSRPHDSSNTNKEFAGPTRTQYRPREDSDSSYDDIWLGKQPHVNESADHEP